MTDARPTISPIEDGWTVEPVRGSDVPDGVRGPIPAAVPGTVHTDLLEAGLIADPLHGTNERLQTWIGTTSWRYSTEFDAPAGDAVHHDLVFEGLDTVATVRLNGETIAATRNQHRSYRVPVAGRLLPTANRLEVEFAAPVAWADRASLELGYRPHVNHHPYNAIRKTACSFGWDWGPDTATSGIWKPVRLESWSGARIAGLVSIPTLEGDDGVVEVRVHVEADGDSPLTVSADIAGRRAEAPSTAGTAILRVRVPEVRRWWPAGYGDQYRYDLAVELRRGDSVLDRRERRIGFRSVELDLTPDAAGTPFRIVVNGSPVLVKGVNWIPDDPFPHRVTATRYRQRLEQAAAAHVNLIRVWGGGIFESDDLYDAADDLGLLVWQDCLLACAAYAEEAPLGDEIEAETREALRRLGGHASFVLLNGNNENVWGHEDWGWKARLDGRTWGAGFYYDVFPRLVAELAPHVAYTPASPFSPDRAMHPNDESNGTMHVWELWNREDWPHYRDLRPRFVAEFGWQGPPNWSTLTAALDDDPLTPESPGMLVHQKAMEGNAKLTDGLVAHLPLPDAMPDWHWAMALNQAVAIRTAVEWFRSLAPHCSGTVLWQLNDCWPVVSWSAIDGAGRLKPLWYALRAAYMPRLVSVQPEGDRLEVALGNDTADVWTGDLLLERRSFDGAVLASTSVVVSVAARAAARVPIPSEVAAVSDAAAEVVIARIGDARGLWFFAEARDSALRPRPLEASARRVPDGVEVRVTARSLARDVAVLADVVDPHASVDDQLVTLLPGEEAVFHVRTTADPDAFLGPHVLRTMNGLLA